MTRSAKALLLRVAVVALAAGAAACSEDLEGSAGCPALCPGQNVPVVDDTLDPVALDTTLSGYPAVGSDAYLLVASRGDTLQSRAVIRFDSLPSQFTQNSATNPITTVDSGYLRVLVDTVGTKLPTSPVTVELYDVDTAAADADVGALAPLFRPDRLIGERTFTAAELRDTLGARVPIRNEVLLDRITNRRALRVGLLARAAESVQLRLFSTDGAPTALAAPIVSFDPSPGDTLGRINYSPYSSAPADRPELAADLADYTVVLASPPLGGVEALDVGGLPARRSYLRFEIPRTILDSSSVIRATLLLTQRPNRSLDAADTLPIYPQIVLAGGPVTDVQRAADFLGSAPNQGGAIIRDSLTVAPGDSGVRAIEVVRLLLAWRARGDTLAPNALVLRSGAEGAEPAQVTFFSTEAADPALRPRLIISYVPPVSFGLP